MSARARKQKAMESERSEASPTSFSRSSTIERSHTSSGSPRKSFSRSERSSSPLTISRSEEKDELAHLNDRLAGYIDYVRKLELDKQKLTKRIQTVTEERMVISIIFKEDPSRAKLKRPGKHMKMKSQP
uniref:Lamin B2 n=1 Tax=Schistosoma japonicum TaxID=6182 RepID=C7TY68_SCHJA|nr:lamin B2 [Schistosoma japonicum]